MMRYLATGLEKMAVPLRRRPIKYQVALLSRQNGKLSMDFQLLREELASRLGQDAIVTHVMKPEMAGKAAFAAGTLEQLKIAMRSRVVIADGYLPTVCIPQKREDSTIIQMWHAPGAIKKFGYQCIDTPAGRTAQAARDAHMHENYDYIIAGGSGAVTAYSQAFGYAPERVVGLGLPHFDYLLDTTPGCARLQRAEQIAHEHPFLRNGKRNVLYAPTLRKGEGYEGWLSDCIELLAANCPADCANVIVAGHPLDHDFDATLLQRFGHLHFVPGIATINLLEFADCVISDYSTVALSAGLLGKPALFYVPDIEAYRLSPGLNIDPLEDERLFASADAAQIMQAATDATTCSEIGARYRHFIADYFPDAALGATRRIADFVTKLL